MTEVPSAPLQSGTSDELSRTRSLIGSRQNLAPVAEFESSDVVASGLDRPFSDVHVNITSSSFNDEGHQNLPIMESVNCSPGGGKSPPIDNSRTVFSLSRTLFRKKCGALNTSILFLVTNCHSYSTMPSHTQRVFHRHCKHQKVHVGV